MTNTFAGYCVLVIFGVVLFGIARISAKQFPVRTTDDFILAGRTIPFSFLAASLFVSWTWTTSIIGSAEAGVLYGISGGVNYALGANIPFLLFIPLVARMRKIMPEASTYTEFIGERFGTLTKDVYFVFASIVAMYVIIEQAVGVGIVLEEVCHLPFKLIVFATIMIATGYIAWGGMRGAIYGDLLHFFLITSLFIVIVIAVLHKYDIGYIYNGLSTEANTARREDLLNIWSLGGLHYGIIALVVAMGQVFLDQGYYSKALAAVDSKAMVWGLIFGIFILWTPVPFISSCIFGHGAIALGMNMVNSFYRPLYSIDYFNSPIVGILFAIMILSVGIGASAKCLVGLQALFTVDFYKSKIKPDANALEKVKFGRVVTVCLGLLCSFVAIALDGMSLLKIDSFCGIFFAAPCGALIGGMYLGKINEFTALLSIAVGLSAGFLCWLFIGDGWFIGSILSLFAPALVILIAVVFKRGSFNFAKLRHYHG